MTDFDAKDPTQLQEFDTRLWRVLARARAYHEDELGPLKGQWDLFAANHRRLWELVAERGDPDRLQVSLRIVEKGQGAVVEIRLIGEDGREQVFQVHGLELLRP